MPTVESVIDALKRVIDPELGKDIVSLGMIKDVKIDGSKVSFTLELTTPACPFNAQIEQQAREAVKSIPGVSEVDMKVTANVWAARTIMRDDVFKDIKNIIAVASGKGGVGKSTVAANIAMALAEAGAKVALLDADIYGPTIPKILKILQPPSRELNGKIKPAETYLGVKVMSLGFFLQDDTPVIWRGPLVSGALRQLLLETNWGEVDYLIIDLPPGCVVSDTVVYSNPGVKAITQLRPGDLVFSFEGDLVGHDEDVIRASLTLRRVVDVIPQGKALVYELRTESRTLRATPNHPVLTLVKVRSEGSEGYCLKLAWRPVASLREGDKVVVVKKMPYIHGEEMEGVKELDQRLLGFEEVKEVRRIGYMDVYDIQVEGTGNFIANGIVAHNTGDAPLTLAQTIPITGVVIVTTPQEASVVIATKALSMFRKLGIPIIGIVENMSYFSCPKCGDRHYIFGDSGGKLVAKSMGVPFLGELPLNPDIREYHDLGKPIVVGNPSSPSAEAFRQLVRNIAGRISIMAHEKALKEKQ